MPYKKFCNFSLHELVLEVLESSKNVGNFCGMNFWVQTIYLL